MKLLIIALLALSPSAHALTLRGCGPSNEVNMIQSFSKDRSVWVSLARSHNPDCWNAGRTRAKIHYFFPAATAGAAPLSLEVKMNGLAQMLSAPALCKPAPIGSEQPFSCEAVVEVAAPAAGPAHLEILSPFESRPTVFTIY